MMGYKHPISESGKPLVGKNIGTPDYDLNKRYPSAKNWKFHQSKIRRQKCGDCWA